MIDRNVTSLGVDNAWPGYPGNSLFVVAVPTTQEPGDLCTTRGNAVERAPS